MLQKRGVIPILLAPILSILQLPFIFIGIVVNEIVRLFLALVLYLVYRSRVELVSDGADSFFGYKKDGSSRNVITYVMTQDPLDPDKIAKFYMDHIQFHRDKNGQRPYKKFEKILTTCFGYFCWKRPNHFNVFNHIRALSEKKVFSQKDFQELLTKLTEDMSEDKPQWEIILVPRYNDGSNEEKSILIARFLHSFMDGLSMMMLFKEHITPDLEYTIDPLKFKIPFWKKILFYLNTLIYGPFFLACLTWEKFSINPWVIRKDCKKRKKYYTWATPSKPLKEETIRKIRLHSGIKATVTNVISTAFVSAALNTLPKERLVDEILISELVAYLPYPDPNPQNRFAYFTYGIPVNSTTENVWEKLKICKKDSLKSMLGPDILVSFYGFKLAGRFPAFMSYIFLYGSYSSVLLSNAPFSKKKVSFSDGTNVLEIGCYTPQPNDLGLSITTTRYGDEVKIFAVADSSWLSQEELTKLINQIPKEIEKMEREIDLKYKPTHDSLMNPIQRRRRLSD